MSFLRQQWLGSSLLLLSMIAALALAGGAAKPAGEASRPVYPRFQAETSAGSAAATVLPAVNDAPAPEPPAPPGVVASAFPGDGTFVPARPAPGRAVPSGITPAPPRRGLAQEAGPGQAPQPPESPQVTEFPPSDRAPAPEDAIDVAGGPLGERELARNGRALQRSERTVFVTQTDVIEMALQNNTDLIVSRFDPELGHYDISGGYGIFDPMFYHQSIYNDDARQTGSSLSGAGVSNRDTTTFATGFRGLLYTGATWDTALTTVREVSNSSFSSINPAWSTTAGFTLRQPLLKNFGIAYNKRNITIARKNRKVSLEHVAASMLNTVFSVEEAYFNLVFALRDMDVKEKSLKLAEKLLEVNHNKVAVGALAPIEELQAETEVAARQEAIILAEKAIEDAEDALKRLIRPEAGTLSDWSEHVYPTDQPIYEPVEVNLDEQVKMALAQRPELREFGPLLEIQDIQIDARKNDLLPSLDLQWKFGYNGLGDTVDTSYHNVGASDYKTYEIGAFLEYPLGNRTARYAVKRAEAEKRRIAVQRRGVEQGIVAEVREAVRAIVTSVRRIEASTKATELARKQLEADEKRLELGLSTSFQVLQFQEDLAQAERNATKAVIDHVVARFRLQKANGTLLDQVNVRMR